MNNATLRVSRYGGGRCWFSPGRAVIARIHGPRTEQSQAARAHRTPRRHRCEVLRLISLGCTVNEIADIVGLSPSIVGNRRSEIMRRLDVWKSVLLARYSERATTAEFKHAEAVGAVLVRGERTRGETVESPIKEVSFRHAELLAVRVSDAASTARAIVGASRRPCSRRNALGALAASMNARAQIEQRHAPGRARHSPVARRRALGRNESDRRVVVFDVPNSSGPQRMVIGAVDDVTVNPHQGGERRVREPVACRTQTRRPFGRSAERRAGCRSRQRRIRLAATRLSRFAPSLARSRLVSPVIRTCGNVKIGKMAEA